MTVLHSHSSAEIALVGDDLYAVHSDGQTIGFVHRAGNLYVANSGPRALKAVEVGQSLSWDEAVSMVRRAFASAA